jgi:large subunit ribosomal protein L5
VVWTSFVTTSANTDEEARELLRLFGFPFPQEEEAKQAAKRVLARF